MGGGLGESWDFGAARDAVVGAAHGGALRMTPAAVVGAAHGGALRMGQHMERGARRGAEHGAAHGRTRCGRGTGRALRMRGKVKWMTGMGGEGDLLFAHEFCRLFIKSSQCRNL